MFSEITKIFPCKVAENLQTLVRSGQIRARQHTNVCKISRLRGKISSLAFDVSALNVVRSVILRRSFQRYQWIFANWSSSKLEKKIIVEECYKILINRFIYSCHKHFPDLHVH